MSDTDGPKRTGRPPKFPEEGARVQLSVRLKPSTGKALREAAEKNNRSLAEEVEYRINQTFESIVLSLGEQTMENLLEEARQKSVSPVAVANYRVTEFPYRKTFPEIVSSGEFAEYISEQIQNSSIINRLRDERASEASFRAELEYIDNSVKSLNAELSNTIQEIKHYEGSMQGTVDEGYRESINSIISSRRIAIYLIETRLSESNRSRDIAYIRYMDAKSRVKSSMQECQDRNLLDKI